MIPGVTYHPRESWEDPNLPVYDPPAYTPPLHDLSLIDLVIDHYTAAVDLPDGDLGEFEYDIPPYLRAIQRDYRLTLDPATGKPKRGYSIGYSWAIDWLGGVWELRGWEYRTAATGGKKVGGGINPRSFAILCLVDGSDPLTDLAAAAHRRVVAEIERRCGPVHLGPHSEYDWTGCCGDGIRAQITAGVLEPSDTEPSPPEDWNMRPHSERALDRTKIAARSTTSVSIGMATEAIVKITALDPVAPGWLSLDGGQTTVVDWGTNAVGRNAVSGTAYVGLDEGRITITAGPAACSVQVDVQGLG